MDAVDLFYVGRPGLISAWRIGDVLVDCGPMARLETLLEGLGDWRPRRLLLTHIHFDHAGAAGALCERWPDLEVYVHRRGARHLLDPTRLVASARRVFGSDLDRRFGPMSQVPAANLHVLDGGEPLAGFETVATPGHASHHISYFHTETGTAFAGDVGGVRIGDLVLPPTPPPDIDLALWRASMTAIGDWSPSGLALPHFGYVSDVSAHWAQLRAALARHEERAASMSSEAYVEAFVADARRSGGAEFAEAAREIVPPEQNFLGLRRWFDAAHPPTP